MRVPGMPGPGTLRRRIFLSFVVFLLALSLPFAAMFALVSDLARKLSDMQSSQAEISALIGSTDEAYNDFSRFILNGDDRSRVAFDERSLAILAGLRRLDRELPGEFHYNIYDLRSMVASFREMAESIHEAWAMGTARIFIDKRLGELARLRNYIEGELTSLLTAYLEHVRSASERLRASLDLYRSVMTAALALLFVAGAIIAARMSRGLAEPIHELANSLRRFSSGDLDVPPIPVRQADEIGVLVEAFNTMTMEIRAHVLEIREKAAMEAELAEQARRALAAENALKQAEVRYLQAQLNPHFLFNALNSLLSLARIEEARRTAESAESLAALLRATLRGGSAMTSLGEEFDMLANYLRVQKLRFGRRLDFALELPPELAHIQVPAMILQPFVENAVIHGIEAKIGGGRVEVGAEKTAQEEIALTIRDDGVGFDPATVEIALDASAAGEHIGIANARRRLSLLYGEGREYVAIDSAPGKGTVLRIMLPSAAP